MKKILFSLALVASFALGTITIQDSNAQDTGLTDPPQGQGGGSINKVDCYSASSGEKKGAWFYDCGNCEKVPNSLASGATKICDIY